MFLNYNTPHKPYSAPRQFFRQVKYDPLWNYENLVKEYLAEVAYADHHVGRLLDSLKKKGVLKNTIVVITADHGEVLWPFHNHSTSWSAFSRFGHSVTMHDEELKVPLIVYYPEGLAPAVVTNQTQLVDLFPTLVSLSKIKAGRRFKKQVVGTNLIPLAAGSVENKIRPAYVQGFMMEALRTDRYKYIYRPPGFNKKGIMGKTPHRFVSEELYDLKLDPFEKKNVAVKNSVALKKMRSLFEIYRDKRIKNHIVFRWKKTQKKVTGVIRTSGAFFRVPGKSAGTFILSRDGRSLSFILKRPDSLQTSFSFQTHPDYATLDFEIFRDGRKVLSRDFFMGDCGVAFLPAAIRIKKRSHFQVSESSGLPFPLAKGMPGVYFFRDKDSFGLNYQKGSSMLSTEIKTVLRDWGYVQK